MSTEVSYNSCSVWRMVLNISLSGAIYVYTLGVFNTCTDNVAAYLSWTSTKDSYITLFSAFIPIGQTVGVIFATPMIDRIGRRKLLIYANVLFIIGSIIMVMPSTAAFGCGRLLTGLATGVHLSVVIIFINEITPVSMMPTVGPVFVIVSNLGLVCSYALGLMLPISDFAEDSRNNLWILMFLLPAVVCFYQNCYFYFYMKYEPPQFYLSRNMRDEAEKALGITHKQTSMETGIRRVNNDIQGKTLSGASISLIGMLCQKKFSKMTRMAFILSILQQLSGFTAMLFYSTVIIQTLGGGLFMARVITLLMSLAYLVSCALASCLLNYFGRKTLLIGGQILVGLDLTALGLCLGYFHTSPTVTAVFIIGFFLPFGIGLDATYWTYTSEILNDQLMSLLCIFNLLASAVVSYFFPVAAASVGIDNCFYFFAIGMFFTAIYSFFDMIETKDKNKEEIYIQMRVISPVVLPRVNSLDQDSLDQACEDEERSNQDQRALVELSQRSDSKDISPGYILDLTTVGKVVNN